MTALKYSRQRESIKDYLMHTNAHPTADMVYLHVKEQFPNISLGTVYRNLNLLSDMGEIIKIPTPDGADRFDGRTVPHYHFFCTECGCMKDMNMECIRQSTRSPMNPLTGSSNHTALPFTGNATGAFTVIPKRLRCKHDANMNNL